WDFAADRRSPNRCAVAPDRRRQVERDPEYGAGRQTALVVGGALRSVFDLALGAPEAKNFGDRSFILGGGQGSSFGTTLDGVSTNTTRALEASWVSVNTPSLEAISEFTVDTNGFKAEYGHSGGGVATFSSKSGTNNLHGSAYEFLRNNKLDARRFFEA